MHRGIATFTLDSGRCPPWLFRRMVHLSREIVRVLVSEYGPDEFVRRVSDPVWFQSLGTVLAFDWNASGLTTTLTAALKEAIRGEEKDLGIFICGGKGKTSRKTPDEIARWGERLIIPQAQVNALVYNSKISAKVDSSLVQDGYQIYHHSFFFSFRNDSGQASLGAWAVVQQGMNAESQTARRYHWFSRKGEDLIVEPHSGIASQVREKSVLNLSARASEHARTRSMELVASGFHHLMKDLTLIRRHSSSLSSMVSFRQNGEKTTLLGLADREFRTHSVLQEDLSQSKYLQKILWQLCDEQPENYEALLARQGVGPKTMRALALVSEVVYGAPPSYEDPARYSFAHGGKDATPFPVDRKTYDRTIHTLKEVVHKSRLKASEKNSAIKRLARMDTLL